MPGSAITDLRRRLELLNAAKRRANRIAALRGVDQIRSHRGGLAGVDRERHRGYSHDRTQYTMSASIQRAISVAGSLGSPMTTQPKSAAAPQAGPPTHIWRDALFLVGVVVLLTLADLVLCITVATH